MSNSYYCTKCKRTMNPDQFYTSNNMEKYPDGGKLTQCKKCVTMHVDNWNPETYLWILQEVDVPYVPKEWNTLLATYGRDKSKLTGLSILGRYLSKMKLKQYKDYRWADTEYLQSIANAEIEQTMKRQGFSQKEIDEALKTGIIPMPEPDPEIDVPSSPQSAPAPIPMATPMPVSGDEVENSLISDLTDEDYRYLCIKWGKTYRPDEWVRLEQLYAEMTNSYDIQAAGDINTLKLACKSSLKANQLLDIGDIDGAQKATKMYDSLMKSGKWTAAQNKAEETEAIDSVGQLVALCERDKFIPRYYSAGPQDHVDRVLEDLQKYTHDLIANESGLSTMIETAIKQFADEQASIQEAANNSERDEEAEMFDYDKNVMLENKDFSDFKDFQLELAEEDNEEILKLLDEEE